jgi:hypothetical protein
MLLNKKTLPYLLANFYMSYLKSLSTLDLQGVNSESRLLSNSCGTCLIHRFRMDLNHSKFALLSACTFFNSHSRLIINTDISLFRELSPRRPCKALQKTSTSLSCFGYRGRTLEPVWPSDGLGGSSIYP